MSGETIKPKIELIWERMNDEEKLFLSSALFPSWVLEYKLTHQETVDLMRMKTNDKI